MGPNNKRFTTFQSLSIATWNVRTLKQPGTPELLAECLHRSNVDICCLNETRFNTEFSRYTNAAKSNHRFKLYSSACCNGVGGVGFMVSSNISKHISLFRAFGTRAAVIILDTYPFNVVIITGYAPHEAHNEDLKNDFYNDLESAYRIVPQNSVVFVAGDFNAQVSKNLHLPQVKGRWSPRDVTSNNGYRLINFADKHKLFMASTAFRHKLSHLYTWLAPNGNSRSQIDHILISQRFRSSVRDVRAFWGYSIGSDHALVKACFSLRLKANRQKTSRFCRSNFLEIPENSANFLLKLQRTLPTAGCSWQTLANTLTKAVDLSKPRANLSTPRHTWIRDATLALFDSRARTRNGSRAHSRLNSQIKSSLATDYEAHLRAVATKMSKAASHGDIGKCIAQSIRCVRSKTYQRCKQALDLTYHLTQRLQKRSRNSSVHH